MKAERISSSKGDQLDELNQQLRRTGLNNFIQKHQTEKSRMLAAPKEFAPNNNAKYEQSNNNSMNNIDTASVAVAVGQKLTKHASDPPDKTSILQTAHAINNNHANKYFTNNNNNNRMLPESAGDNNNSQNRDKLEGVWV